MISGRLHWVQQQLAADLHKAGVKVMLARWENAKIGASVARFVEQVARCDCVVVVGTPLYRQKYDNKDPMGGFVVAVDGDLIGKRMIDTSAMSKPPSPAPPRIVRAACKLPTAARCSWTRSANYLYIFSPSC